jgi:hypothetical protein
MTVVRPLRRLLSMDGREIRFRASGALRRGADRLSYLARRPSWNRAVLEEALRDDAPELTPTLRCLKRRDWIGAHTALMDHLIARTPRFVIDPGLRDARSSRIQQAFPRAAADAIARAEPILAGRFDLLGYRGLRFSETAAVGHPPRIDWHVDPVHHRRGPMVFWSRVPYLEPSCADHKIVWELNRHQYWLTLGRAYWLTSDRRYRSAFVEHLASWLTANPPMTGMNWASMLELAFRSIAWLWALHFFATETTSSEPREADSSPWTVDLLVGLDRQLVLVERNLSRYFSPNTHLLGEALALYVVGRTLPELRRAGRWEAIGRSTLLEQISKQINADGGHKELSTHYHRYTLDFYLLALAVARLTSDTSAEAFANAVAPLARFARTIADAEGRMPGVGDEDGGMLLPLCGRDPSDVADSLQLAACLLDEHELVVGLPAEEVVWMTGSVPVVSQASTVWRSAALWESGYFVSRSDRGDHLTVDAGPHGFLNAGHAHADALSVTLGVRGRPLLVETGTGCYTSDATLRDRLRSTPSHNTLTLNGRSQSIPDGPFHWRSRADAMALDWQSGDAFDYFEGSHDGYAPVVHHRTILSRPGCWLVVDRVLGTGVHRADTHWHLEPSWHVTLAGRGGARAEYSDGTTVWLVSPHERYELFRGTNDESGLGWWAPVYGRLEKTTSLRATRLGGAPFSMVTAIVESGDEPDIEMIENVERTEVSPQEPESDSEENAVGFRVKTAEWTDTLLFSWRSRETTSPRSLAAPWRIGDIDTDARVLCWRDTPEQPAAAVVLIDGTFARRHSAPASGDGGTGRPHACAV